MAVGTGSRRLMLLAVAVLASLALLAPGGAAAATVVNGDFESGTLRGWDVHRVMEVGNWFAYKGSEEPIKRKEGTTFKIQAPPQGLYAAIADQLNPETLILSQDVALEPGLDHRLSLLAYFNSYKALAVPSPDTLSVDGEALAGQANQQFRIDVMRPAAPIESVDPADILLTVFRTRSGGPREMPPTRLTADLSPFAGQTVRLRIAVAAQEEVLAAGVDAVSIASAPPGQLPPLGSTRLSFGKPKANPRNGTATLPVKVPGPGRLTAKAEGPPPAKAGAGKAKKPVKLIKPISVKAKAAGTVTLHLKPTPAALAILRQKHKLRIKVAVTYAPTTGSPQKATVPVLLKLKAAPHHRP